jgi:putative redox protein
VKRGVLQYDGFCALHPPDCEEITMTGGLTEASSDPSAANDWVTARIGPDGFRTELEIRTHGLIADEPVTLKGTDRGPTPYEYLLGALGSCMVMTLRIYADRKGWPLEGVEVRLRTARSHEKDCEDCEKAPVGITRIERRLDLFGPLSEEQRARLLQIADRCPVKQTLERGVQVVNANR